MSPRDYERGNPIGSGSITREGDGAKGAFQVQDISGSGLSLVAADGFEVGDVLQVVLEITDILFEKTIHLKGKILKKEPSNGSFTYALKILKIDLNDRIEIDEMIGYLNVFNENFSSGLITDESRGIGVKWLANLNDKKSN